MPLPRHFWKSSVPVMLHPLCVDIRGFFFHGSLRQAVLARNTRVPRDFRTPTRPMPSKSVQSAPDLCRLLVALPDFKNPQSPGQSGKMQASQKPPEKKIFIIVLRALIKIKVPGKGTIADQSRINRDPKGDNRGGILFFPMSCVQKIKALFHIHRDIYKSQASTSGWPLSSQTLKEWARDMGWQWASDYIWRFFNRRTIADQSRISRSHGNYVYRKIDMLTFQCLI